MTRPIKDFYAIVAACTEPVLAGVTHARFLNDDDDAEGPVALCNKDDFPLCVLSFKAYKWFRENDGKLSPEGA